MMDALEAIPAFPLESRAAPQELHNVAGVGRSTSAAAYEAAAFFREYEEPSQASAAVPTQSLSDA